MATEATLQHAVVVAVMAPKGQGVKSLQKMLKDLQDGH